MQEAEAAGKTSEQSVGEESDRTESPLTEEKTAAYEAGRDSGNEEEDIIAEEPPPHNEPNAETAVIASADEEEDMEAAKENPLLSDEEDNNKSTDDEIEITASENADFKDKSSGAPEKEQPVSLSMQDIFRAVPSLIQSPVQPIETDNRPYVLLYDLDRDQIPEVFVPAVDDGPDGSSSLAELSDFTRVYDDKSGRPVFFIYVFKQEDEKLKLLHRIQMGRKPAIASLLFKRISTESPVPVSLVASFHFVEGEEINWINFSGIEGYSHLSVQTSVDVQVRETDIDSDSFIDILIYRKKVEEGIGYEKYISRMQWKEKQFTQTAVTNIVRNLRDYLEKTKLLLISARWDEFVQDALSSENYSLIVKNNSAPEEIIPMIFTPVAEENGERAAFDYYSPERKISEIVFPELSRSPFDPAGTAVFSPLIRIVCCEGEARIFSCRIKMNKNPFQERQFVYLLE